MALTLYRGFPLCWPLPTREVRDGDRRETQTAGATRADAPSGAFVVGAVDRPLVATHELAWPASDRATLVAVEEFLAACAGRFGAYWLPTLRDDFTVVAAGLNTRTVASWGYASTVFPAFSAVAGGDHLLAIRPDGTYRIRRITAAVDNGDGTDTLTLSTALGTDIGTASQTLLSPAARFMLLRLARLDTDTITTTYTHGECATIRVPAVEIPRETP